MPGIAALQKKAHYGGILSGLVSSAATREGSGDLVLQDLTIQLEASLSKNTATKALHERSDCMTDVSSLIRQSRIRELICCHTAVHRDHMPLLAPQFPHASVHIKDRCFTCLYIGLYGQVTRFTRILSCLPRDAFVRGGSRYFLLSLAMPQHS